MQVNLDCQAWEALSRALRQAAVKRVFNVVDEISSEMHGLAVKIIADPHRSAAIRHACPGYFAAIEASARSDAAPRQIPDPAHNEVLLHHWLSGLSDGQLATLQKAVKAEAAERKKPPKPLF